MTRRIGIGVSRVVASVVAIVGSLAMHNEARAAPFQVNLVVDLSSAVITNVLDEDGNAGQQIDVDVDFAPIGDLFASDTLTVNLDFLGSQRIRLMDTGAPFRLNDELLTRSIFVQAGRAADFHNTVFLSGSGSLLVNPLVFDFDDFAGNVTASSFLIEQLTNVVTMSNPAIPNLPVMEGVNGYRLRLQADAVQVCHVPSADVLVCSSIPEPGTTALVGLGALGLFVARRRR